MLNTRAKSSATYIKEKMNDCQTNEAMILLLNILDYMMAESKLSFHTQVANKEFLACLTNFLKIQKADIMVKNKILYLIKKWGNRFESQRDLLPNFYEMYVYLKNNKVQFPDYIE